MTHLLRPLPLLLLLGALGAADQPIAIETVGEHVHGRALAIPSGGTVDSGSHLARVNFSDGAAGYVLLAPNSEVSFTRTQQAGAPPQLILRVERGRVEVNLERRGPYAELHVLGGATDTRVTGTLFIVERTARQSDYIAMIHGHVSVRLRNDVTVAIAGGQRDHAELTDRQGILGDATGLSPTDTLTNRPQLTLSASVHDQGTNPQGSGGWDQDAALATLTAELAAALEASEGLSETIANQVALQIAASIQAQITGEVINQTLGGGPSFGSPPPPP